MSNQIFENMDLTDPKVAQELYQQLLSVDYYEEEVSILKFIQDNEYLGQSTNQGKMIYPFWKKKLTELFESPNNKFQVVFTGAIGGGKTTVATICMAYLLYQVANKKNPWEFYGMVKGSPIVFLFFNIAKEQAQSSSLQLLHNFILNSPWFQKRFGVKREKINLPSWLQLNISSSFQRSYGGKTSAESIVSGILGQNIYAGCFSGDTKIETKEYGVVNMVDITGQILTFKKVLNSGKVKWCVSKVVHTGIKPMYKITLKNGSIIKVTPDQILSTPTGPNTVENLHIGDKIGIISP